MTIFILKKIHLLFLYKRFTGKLNMSHQVKNIIILFLILLIAFLAWTVFDLSYGRYCTPIIKEEKLPKEKDSLK